MTEYWLISAPGDKTCQQTWETMNNLTSKQNNLSVNYKFHIPDLKVGTLDQLVGLSDDLGKLDAFVEQVTRKVSSYLGEVLEDQRDKLQENLMANNSGRPPEDEGGGGGGSEDKNNDSESSSGVYVTPLQSPADSASSTPDQTPTDMFLLPLGPADLPTYLTRFQWDIAKYPIKQSLRNIADIISKQVGQIDADLKTKSTAYNNLKGNLQNLEKKQTGSLLTRNLADLVKKEHFILDSEYLTTLLVIVPKSSFNEWNANYEKITDMIVPRSSQLITQDNEYGLYTVSLFKKVVEEFKLHARERKFIVRDFTYNEEELAAGKNEITKLVTDKKKQFGPLVRWLKVNFSECFCAWIHVKALRVFVESVLRYGLPVNFQAILIHPNKKTMKRLRDVLNQLYGHLDSSAAISGSNADSVDIPGLGFGQSEYYPYVYYKINVDMIEQTKV
ncbi:V-type proton ATPase subunit C isoform X2 [Tribolium castaneum]|nr:PREDICTED: V-type proton ATPase subunit C isoform X2 [Tribolium castaneum]XP_015836983.1 PREDICTED: V-type proton ATPase subunit C isoform X2 [Tribolium castaneum]|eukprot:XP_015836982.1 PREDICTED: V-type proton ATPase subunit C isoform X2 [Tribolium castaneum]